MGRTVFIANHARSGVAALNVVAAALPPEVPVVFAHGEGLRAAVAAAHARGDRPLVGWSFYSTDFAAAAAELRQLPREGVLHLAGGVHATARPAEVLAAGFDLVAVGEGEGTVRALVAALDAGQDLDTVPGLARLRGGALWRGPPAPRHPLGSFPAFHLAQRKFNPIEITRGCVYACTFCQTPYAFKARFRHRPVDDVATHVAAMAEAGLQYVRFVTPTALSYGSEDTRVHLGAVEALLRAVRAAFGPGRQLYFGSFPSELRPEHVDDAALQLLAAYVDNRTLILGAQSGSDRVLALMRRGHDVGDVLRAVERCVRHGFVPDVDFLFGFPGEELDDQRASLALAERLAGMGARIHTHAFLPLPGTPRADEAPAPIAAEIAAGIAALEARGRAHGAWRRQVQDGLRLAETPGD